MKRRLAKIGSFEILYEKKKKAFKQSKSQKAHFSLEMENKKFAMKKKTISLDLTNEDTIKSKRKKNMEIVKSELKKLDVIQDESPTEAKNPQLVTLGMFICSGVILIQFYQSVFRVVPDCLWFLGTQDSKYRYKHYCS